MIENWWLIAAVMFISSVYCTRFVAATVNWRANRQQTTEHMRLRETALAYSSHVARLSSQLGRTTSSASEIAWRILEVADVVAESADCRSFYLVDPYGQELPQFYPGQYIMVRPALAGAYQATRCYSLSSSPDARYWRITVKEHEPSNPSDRNNSSGLSSWLHRTISTGDCLFVGGPNGQFFLPPESSNDLVLLAAGVGITPMASMLRWSLEHTPERKVTLLYQAKDIDHWPLGEAIHAWQPDFESLHVHTFFSRETLEEIEWLANELPGHFHSAKIESQVALFAKKANTDYYLCGPDRWMDQLRDQLIHSGVPAEHIHWESFGSKPAPASNQTKNFESHVVRFSLSETDVTWQDAEQSVWELAKANRLEIPSGCLSGVCGSCRVKVVSGEVEYDRQIGIELSSGECLTCIARPTTDLVLEA